MSSSNIDFDAKLLDWLYGELDSDDVASFEAYLETHPEQRSEAYALRDTRSAFQGLPEAEPSKALTSSLMQQAASAAQPKGGLWASFVGFFQPLVMHPAAAAMATIVVVAGVAGTLYLRTGSIGTQAAAPVSAAEPPQERLAATARASEGKDQFALAPKPEFADSKSAGDMAWELGEDEEPKAVDEAKALEPVEVRGRDMDNARGFTAGVASKSQEKLLAKASRPNKKTKSKADSNGPRRRQLSQGVLGDVTTNAISGGGVPLELGSEGTSEIARSAPAAKPAPTSTATREQANKQDKAVADGKVASWEAQQVQQFQAAARRKRCKDAGRIANDLKERSPSTYKKDVQGSREESSCSYSIASETKRRKSARAKTARKKRAGAGKSVPKRATAAPAEDSFEAEAEAEGL